ncbi:MAG: hypothetical protein AB7P52_07415 [Alphaproteobacteria bacterium]
MKTASVIVAVMLGMAMAPLHAAEREGDHAPVRLGIRNEAADAVLRCQVVLAHFVTLADHRLAPGETRELDLQRAASSGALFVSGEGGRLMAVENVYCGLDAQWDGTRVALDLTPLREPARQSLGVACAAARTPLCR